MTSEESIQGIGIYFKVLGIVSVVIFFIYFKMSSKKKEEEPVRTVDPRRKIDG